MNRHDVVCQQGNAKSLDPPLLGSGKFWDRRHHLHETGNPNI